MMFQNTTEIKRKKNEEFSFTTLRAEIAVLDVHVLVLVRSNGSEVKIEQIYILIQTKVGNEVKKDVVKGIRRLAKKLSVVFYHIPSVSKIVCLER